MFDSIRDLMEKMRLGEDTYIEMKEIRFAGQRVSAPTRDDLADELAAFANARGGVCVLGVEDKTREVTGIPLALLDRAETFVREICNDSIEPPLFAAIERILLPTSIGTEAAVLKIESPRSLFVHSSPGGYLHRVGSSKRKMSPEYLARLFQQRSQARIIRFDEQIVPRATLENLDEQLWRRFQTNQSLADVPEVYLHKLGLARQDEDGVWRPTASGVLLATHDPRLYMPNAFIQAVAYRSSSSASTVEAAGYQLDAKDITGPIDVQVEEAFRFVARNMLISASKDVGRTDLPQYDMTAVLEALVNAVAHRDYAIYGSKIRLRLYADRLELYSPGALANTMTVESLPHRQSARNEVLTSLLARCPVPADLPGLKSDRTMMMDKRGEGVRVILDRTLALSGSLPVYRVLDGEELLLIIPAANGALASGDGVTA